MSETLCVKLHELLTLICYAITSDVPYMPSFILSLPELSPTLRNVKDLAFLPGFNNPTLAILFCPIPTATGRTTVPRDSYHIEIRTLDPLGQTYPLISSTEDLPSDAQYIVPCPQSIGGVLLVTATAVFHVDQSGKYVSTSSNGWFKFVSNITPTKRREECMLELDGSHVVWADEGNFLMILRDSTIIQARLEVEGRSVVGIDLLSPAGPEGLSLSLPPKIGLQMGLEQPSSVCEIALPPSEDGRMHSAFFAASAVGDSCLVTVNMVPEETNGPEPMNGTTESKREEMDVDLDDGECKDLRSTARESYPFDYLLIQTSMETLSSGRNLREPSESSCRPIFPLAQKCKGLDIFLTWRLA